MFGDFLFGEALFAEGAIATPGVYTLTEALSLSDGAPDVTVMFLLNEFIFQSDNMNTSPEAFVADSIRLSDWLTVKAKQEDSTFQD